MAQGAAGNVIAAICSFLIPGLGQLVQGRILAAAIHLIVTVLLWIFWLGWIMAIYSAFDAATFRR